MTKLIPVCAASIPQRCFRCFKVRAYAYYIASADADPSSAEPLCESCAE